MPHSDDKPRGVSVREASRLRATLGSEPSSGYAFHDHVRVERVRPGARDNGPQVASHAPSERSFAHTLVGGVTIQEALSGQPLRIEPSAPSANDQQDDSARMSWPGLPQVPNELVGSLEQPDAPVAVRPSAIASTVPPAKPSSAPPSIPAGGAIWEAMPSLVGAPVAVAIVAERESAPGAAVTVQGNERPAPYRPSAAELEAEQAHAYGDPRVLKYEPMVERNAWEQLAEELGRERDLSPVLLLLRVVAERETLKADRKQEAARLAQQGISAMAQLLGLPEASPTALVLGKRLLRRNPGWTTKQPASTGLSLGLLLSGLAVGAGIGWLITTLLF